MKLPNLSDVAEMANIGRLYTLRSARRKEAQQLRDKLIPLLNNIEQERGVWDVTGIDEHLNTIKALNEAIEQHQR